MVIFASEHYPSWRVQISKLMKTMAAPSYPWLPLLFLFTTLFNSPAANSEPGRHFAGAAPKAVYDPDPNHLWNRLHGALFIRVASDGTEYGIDQLDPLLFYHSKYLLTGPSHTNALRLLDEFLSSRGDSLIPDPLKHALLQRDLWTVFDWTTHASSDVTEQGARRSLRQRLALILRRLALTQKQIDALPDNYVAAVKSHQFSDAYDASRPATAFLPPDLFSTNGSWVRIGIHFSGEEPFARVHTTRFGGRSVFLVFMQTAGGRQEAVDYLRRFRKFPQPYIYKSSSSEGGSVEASLNPNLPALSAGTTLALVRQTILISDSGELVPTHITESVQLRRYNDVQTLDPSRASPPESQSVFEFSLSRAELLRDHAGGLHASTSDQKTFLQFMDKGFDPFEESEREHKPITPWLHAALDCRECHSAPGLFSVLSLVRSFTGREPLLPQVSDVDPISEGRATRIWKEKQFNWGLLQGLRERVLPSLEG